nr:MAG TPA: hypothetical protein [Caudoviricetes sp.]
MPHFSQCWTTRNSVGLLLRLPSAYTVYTFGILSTVYLCLQNSKLIPSSHLTSAERTGF